MTLRSLSVEKSGERDNWLKNLAILDSDILATPLS